MEKTIKKAYSDESIEWLSFSLSRVQSYYLYVFSVIGFLYCLGLVLHFSPLVVLPLIGPLLTDNVQYGDSAGLILYFLILSALPIIAIVFFVYTIKKIKPFLSKSISEKKRKENFWFGVLINQNQASILFFLALFGLYYSVSDIISGFSSSLLFLDIGRGSPGYMALEIIESLLYGSKGLVLLITSLYTIQRTRKFTIDDSEKPLWFGFELSEQVRLIVFIGSMLGIFITSALMLMYGSLSVLNLVQLVNGETPGHFFGLIYLFYFGTMLVFLPLAIYSFLKVRRMKGYNSDQITSGEE